jgi:hypothetical protein
MPIIAVEAVAVASLRRLRYRRCHSEVAAGMAFAGTFNGKKQRSVTSLWPVILRTASRLRY